MKNYTTKVDVYTTIGAIQGCLVKTEAYDKCDFGDIWTVDEVVYGIKIGYPAFDLNKHEWDCNGLSELNESGNYFYEVIGNIYDNPELLKGGVDNA